MPTPVWVIEGGGWSRVRAGAKPLPSDSGLKAVDGALVLDAGMRSASFGAHLVPHPDTAVLLRELTTPGASDAYRVVASLNADPWPAGATARLWMRAFFFNERDWTPTASLGLYGSQSRSEVGQDPAKIEVDVDTVKLPPGKVPERLEVRLELTAGTDGTSPRIRRVALLAWKKGEAPADPLGARGPAWGKELAVPERSQQALPQELRPRCCSPTSLSMVLAFHGHDLPTEEVCKGVHDEGARIYGNWSFNVAFAGRLGLRAVVGRCTSMQDLDDEIAAGRPVVLSHRYAAGEVQGAAVNGTDGHLIVARGITPDGDVVVNDPAADPLKGQPIRRVYRRADLARSWLGNGSGICYLVRPE